MRIVDAYARRGNPTTDSDYGAGFTRVLILIISVLIAGCAAPLREAPPADIAAPPLQAADLALIERMQAEYALQGGDRVAAAQRLAQAAILSDDPKQSLSALRAALLANRLPAAEVLLARWRGLEPAAPALPAYTAALALAKGDSKSAHAAADQLTPEADARRRLAEALRWLASLERVLPFVESRLDRSENVETWLHWAAFARDRRAPETAMRLADLATQKFPGDARTFTLRAALLRERDPASARADLERALVLDPSSANIRLSLAHALDAAGDSAAAAAIVSGITPVTDESVAAEIGYAARSASRAPLIRAYQHLSSLSLPHPPGRLMLLGNVAELIEEPMSAEQWYAAVPKGELQVNAQLRLATLRFAAGDGATARRILLDLRAAGVLARDVLVRTYLLEGEIAQRSDGADAAISVFNTGLQTLSDDGELIYSRALMFAELERYDDMERDLRRLIELDPGNADAYNALGYTLADRNVRLDEAAALLEKAKQLQPDSPALLDSLGWLAFRRGDLDTALEKLRAAHSALDDPEVAAHLGEVLWMRGDQAAARSIWHEARKREPGHKTLNATIKRLAP